MDAVVPMSDNVTPSASSRQEWISVEFLFLTCIAVIVYSTWTEISCIISVSLRVHTRVWTYVKCVVKQDCVCMQGRCGFLQVPKLIN